MATATSADGTRIHWEVEGSGEVPVILLHGLGDSVEGWAAQRPALSEQCRLLLVDVRGHGDSALPADDDYSIAAMAADVRAAADAAGFDRAHVVGISMGGGVAIELAVQAPELVASLVIVNATPTARLGGWRGRALIGTRKLLARFLTPSQTASAAARRLFPDPDQEHLRQELVRRLGRNDPHAYRQSLFALAAWDRVDDAAQLSMPTLYVHSEHDYTPLAWRQPFVDAMPDARLVQIDGAHHAVPMERPDEFNAVLLDRLGQVSTSTS
jgi:pimeloyl-ACP methyl ester carboxylesterase